MMKYVKWLNEKMVLYGEEDFSNVSEGVGVGLDRRFLGGGKVLLRLGFTILIVGSGRPASDIGRGAK